MYKTLLVAAATLGALSLQGCTSGNTFTDVSNLKNYDYVGQFIKQACTTKISFLFAAASPQGRSRMSHICESGTEKHCMQNISGHVSRIKLCEEQEQCLQLVMAKARALSIQGDRYTGKCIKNVTDTLTQTSDKTKRTADNINDAVSAWMKGPNKISLLSIAQGQVEKVISEFADEYLPVSKPIPGFPVESDTENCVPVGPAVANTLAKQFYPHACFKRWEIGLLWINITENMSYSIAELGPVVVGPAMEQFLAPDELHPVIEWTHVWQKIGLLVSQPWHGGLHETAPSSLVTWTRHGVDPASVVKLDEEIEKWSVATAGQTRLLQVDDSSEEQDSAAQQKTWALQSFGVVGLFSLVSFIGLSIRGKRNAGRAARDVEMPQSENPME
jgi:hypothetical protein